MLTEFNWAENEETNNKSFANIRKVFIETKMRSFLTEYRNAAVYANKDYHKFGHRESDKCDFCEEPEQDFKHLFIDCTVTRELYDRIDRLIGIIPREGKERWLGVNDEATDYIYITMYGVGNL